jgi:hypothetical protein
MWDMASPKRVEAFTAAAEQAEADLRSSAEVMAAGDPEARTVTHDNHPAGGPSEARQTVTEPLRRVRVEGPP